MTGNSADGGAAVCVTAVTVTRTVFDAAFSLILAGATATETVTSCVTGAVGSLVSVSWLPRSSTKDTRARSGWPMSAATGV